MRFFILCLFMASQIATAENWLQSYSIESKKYPDHCMTVINAKSRFDNPQTWKPVVELRPCQLINNDRMQRWFINDQQQIAWAYDYNVCLSKKAFGNPTLAHCKPNQSEQRFNLKPRHDYYLIESQSGGCIASGVIDIGDIQKVEPSLCVGFLPRNHWYIEEREMLSESVPFLLGRIDVRTADIGYSNSLTGSSLSVNDTRQLVKDLYNTNALNINEVIQELALAEGDKKGDGFAINNPYLPKYTGSDIPLPKPRSAIINGIEVINPEGYDNIREGYSETNNGVTNWSQQEIASRWFSNVTNNGDKSLEVCAVRFNAGSNTDYSLKTFATQAEAELAGFTVTHQYQCGACSTLQDLAVYIGIPNQTEPVRLCTKRANSSWNNLDELKQCIQESVGFSEQCAEAWAYNGVNSAKNNMNTCLATYGGFWNVVIKEEFNACPPEVETDDPVLRAELEKNGCPLANEVTGKLNACLWADERVSGPGFKYTAARTRRGSGIPSAIPRPNDKLFYEADHTQYFK